MTYLGQHGWKQRETVLDLLKWQRAGMRASAARSSFYDRILTLCIADYERGDRRIGALLERTPMSYDSAATLRLLAGIQRCVLGGEGGELAAVWPNEVAPGDPDAAYELIKQLLVDPPTLVLDWLTRDPQTNEVGRAAGLACGLAVIAMSTGLAIRLFEIGSSAGLNLRLDSYRYTNEQGETWGAPEAALRFDAASYVGNPPFSADARIAHRVGCDLNPIDATTNAGELQLLSYVWPDHHSRIARLRAALVTARTVPVTIEQSSASDWVARRVIARSGFATVLMHSIMWQYLPEPDQSAIRSVLVARGVAASNDAPLAWLTLEPAPDLISTNVTVTMWPSGESRVVARAGFHGPPITWLGATSAIGSPK